MGGGHYIPAISTAVICILLWCPSVRADVGFRFVPDESDSWRGMDKVEHFSLAALAAGSWYAFDRTSHSLQECSDQRAFFISVAGVSAIGLTLEVFQGFYREKSGFSWKDLTCDVAGSIVGAFIMSRFVRHNPRLEQKARRWDRGF